MDIMFVDKVINSGTKKDPIFLFNSKRELEGLNNISGIENTLDEFSLSIPRFYLYVLPYVKINPWRKTR